MYKNKKNITQAFLRGDFPSGSGAMGGVCSLFLNWNLGFTDSHCGFRS